MKSVATLPVTRYNFEHAAKKSCRRQRRQNRDASNKKCCREFSREINNGDVAIIRNARVYTFKVLSVAVSKIHKSDSVTL